MPQEWREVLERRNRTSKTRRLYEDGQPTRKYSWDGQVGTSAHYPDAEGAWQDVDVNAEDPDTDGFTLKFTKLSYFGRVDGEGRRRFYPDRNDLAYWIEFKKPYANMGTPTRHNRWFYWDFAHATIGVRFDVDSLKFGFRLKDAQAPTSITIPFETQGITRQGRLLYHNGEVVAELRKPIATGSNLDAEGLPVQKECNISFAPGEVTISLDPSGLEYPIEIDPTVDVQVGASADDRGDKDDGTRYAVDAADIRCYQYTAGNSLRRHGGHRFTGLGLPQGATVGVAYAQLYVIPDDDPYCDIYCEDQQNPPNFADGSALIQNRTRTTASAEWVADNIGADAFKNTPSLVGPIQEIVTDYTVDTLVLLFIGKIGSFKALTSRSYDGVGEGTNAAKLYIEYTAAGGTKTLAGVSAGVAGVSGNAVATMVLAGVSAGVASVFGVLYEEIQALILVAVKRSFAPEAETRKLALDAEKREFDLTAVHRDRP